MKILISYLTGLGNTILFLPTLRTLRQQFPEAAIDVIVRHQASKEILERIGCCREILVFNPSIHRTFFERIEFFREFRRKCYDVSLTAFPSNRAEFNLFSFLAGARRRIAPKYRVGYWQTCAFLQTEFVDMRADLHEVEENLLLLAPLGVQRELGAENKTGFPLTPEEQLYADQFLEASECTSSDILIGFHPGCNPAQGNLYRRWPTASFAELGDRLIEAFGAKILIGFGGPEETPLLEEIVRLMTHQPIQTEPVSIFNTAALMKKCCLFVAADSGLMHLSTAMNVPTVSLSGPIDSRRNAPYGTGHTLIKADLPCVPCNTYPHEQYGGSYIRCIYDGDRQGACMQSISADHVFERIVEMYSDRLVSRK